MSETDKLYALYKVSETLSQNIITMLKRNIEVKDKRIAELEAQLKTSTEERNLAWTNHNRIWAKLADLKLQLNQIE
jgi:hypothetical protein